MTHIKARQIKAARALLDWSQDDLATSSGLSVATIRKLETGFVSPRGKTMTSVRRTLEDAGLDFIEPDGVRRKPEDVIVYQGPDGLMSFLDDVYDTMKKKGGEIVTLYDSEKPFSTVLAPQDDKTHLLRMESLKDRIDFKCILKEPTDSYDCTGYCTYRHLSKQYVNSVPFYVYADRFASILFDADPAPKIIVIKSAQMAEAYRQQFRSMWDKALPLHQQQTKKRAKRS